MTEHGIAIAVLSPGAATTVQDAGRVGLRHLGVARAGAADAWSHAIANLLVGNPEDASVLEITLTGPTLHFAAPARIALYGGGIDADADGIAVPGQRPVDLPAGTMLRLGGCRSGARSYLAIAGGFRVQPLLGSTSTDLRGGFGGIDGRALRKGDRLHAPPQPCRDRDAPSIAHWWIDASPLPQAVTTPSVHTIRLLPGEDAAPGLFDAAWQVDPRSNRQGVRLQGPSLVPGDSHERISEPVVPGTVQLPPDGQPIVLLADAQTHGGYPRIGHAIRADWPLLAQLRPGDRVRFAACSRDEARDALCRQRQRLHRIALALDAKRSPRG